ncbi:MAG: S8 family serine peptidase [Acidobacteriota bacterium]
MFSLVLVPALLAGTAPGRYIVELSAEPGAAVLARTGRRAADSGTARARVHAAQEPVRARVERLGGRVLDCLDLLVNALVVEAPSMEALQNVPGVRRVHAVYENHPALHRALRVHKVEQAWGLLGKQGAGAGVRIGIIDTGIDISHPGLQDRALPMPEGFPRVNAETDLVFTNSKVIVARSYLHLMPWARDLSARDAVGHGTASAMAAAGVPVIAPLATISGIAPKAYLGSYKVGGESATSTSAFDDAVMKAIEDAVSDQMDVIYLGYGRQLGVSPSADPVVQAIERAVELGVVVVCPAGNDGPQPHSLGFPANAPSAITVGASYNDRVFAGALSLDARRYAGVPVAAPGAAPISAPIADLRFSQEGPGACSPLPEAALAGKIALVAQGGCYLDDKLLNVRRAGALAAVTSIESDWAQPYFKSLATVAETAAALPLLLVSPDDALEIAARTRQNPAALATLEPGIVAQQAEPNRVAYFSGRGPTVDDRIKPDLVAVGLRLYTATQSTESLSPMYDVTGYTSVQGTSFSGPQVAGAAAVLKAARPGLTEPQLRSLLINTASPLLDPAGKSARVQDVGAGSLNLEAALESEAAAFPTSISFGSGFVAPNLTRKLTVFNLAAKRQALRLSVVPREEGPAPVLSAETLELEPGASAEIELRWQGLVDFKEYDGVVRIEGADSTIRVPYWYAVRSSEPRYLFIVSPRALTFLGPAILFRVTDAYGSPLRAPQPEVSVISGSGKVLGTYFSSGQSPSSWASFIDLGSERGATVFRIRVNQIEKLVTVINE